MSISEETVKYVAKLAGLAIGENEVPKIQSELNDILNYVERLGELNTAGVEETSHVHGVTNAFREDIIKDSLTFEDVAKNAPEFSTSGFRVPRIIG